MTSLIESCRVSSPSGTVADQSLPLTFFDIVWLHFHPCGRLFFHEFPCSKPFFLDTLVPKLKHSLSQTLKHYFPLAGNLVYPLDTDKIKVPISASLHTHASFVSMFNGHNYTEWCEQIQFHLGVLELDLALHVDKPAAITDTSSEGEISVHTAWERSNRLSLMLMRMTIASNIKSTLPPTENAKDFIKLVGERSQTADKSLAGTLMATLTTIKFDGSRSMYEHVMEMTNIAARLKSLEMKVDDSFLVQFVLNSLPPEYGPFQMNYNTMKDKWNVNELHSMLVQEETRLKNQGTHSVHLITNQGAGKGFI
ncbi:hypothetical protein CASFOL_031430 [Castilleja foliolosa]|uniref:Uncharacterized protein n=1 Tax=Castilleja foliolosa TaxID=1961234 RepID=A0ABD3C5D5_9LAMI